MRMQIRHHDDDAGREPAGPLAGPEQVGGKKMRGDDDVERFLFQPSEEGPAYDAVPGSSDGLNDGVDAARIEQLKTEPPDRREMPNEEVVRPRVQTREEGRFKRQDIPALDVGLRKRCGRRLRDGLSGSPMAGTGSSVRDEDADGNDYAGSRNRRNRS